MAGAKPARTDDGERRPSLVDDAYAVMKLAIRTSDFAPGYQASEQEIALRHGMSRTPVHGAAIRLQEDGLVRVLPRCGILICAIAPEDLREIYDVIIAFEGHAAARVAGLPEPERLRAASGASTPTPVRACLVPSNEFVRRRGGVSA
ncbi:GntR family transcriptional regulator [Methylobacterium terricola]|uniref:GntR family transcriptional regulator n=1 Tax=Methylobacterium terricola TaxID=2583531 RepID=A0A5C4LMA3_9HYPH|nr:GntR family transcriptional regulator [Methylobacterium terricola]